MNIVFFGSADFGVPSLRALLEAGHVIKGIITTPPRPQGRGLNLHPSAIQNFAQQAGLGPVLAPEQLRDLELEQQLKQLQADIFIVIAYRILPQSIFSIPPMGTFNIHASLLPRFRGPAPIHRAIQAGQSSTGVTLFRINAGIDTGSIVLQRELSIAAQETTPQLYERLSLLGAQVLVDGLELLGSGDAQLTTQDESLVSSAPKLHKQEGHLDWKSSSHALFNNLRAFKPFPGTFTCCDNKRLGIEWAEALDEQSSAQPGTVVGVGADYFDVACAKGILRVLAVKPEGKKIMNSADFLRGTSMQQGTCLV
jgi:methionyl-tRNA formyltransferase